MTRAGLVVLLLSLSSAAAAQRGPADVITGARNARDARELQQAADRGANPPGDAPNNAAPPRSTGAVPPTEAAGAAPSNAEPNAADQPQHPTAPHAMEEPSERQPIATERPDTSLPDGTIVVRVIDQAGAPVPSADVALGIMNADSSRASRAAKTGLDGRATFAGLASGEKQAYRINVPNQGAKYSSTPFRLPPKGGYAVQIRRLPVTRDERMVVLYMGATSVELKDDRIKVVQQAQLLNLGSATYVFPEAGTLMRLPKGFLAVQTQESMTDQHVTEAKGEGLRVKGSLPPGEATVLWGFDLPLRGSEASFTVDVPWLIFAYRVITDAPPGMTLEVDGMPEPIVHSDAGRHFLVTEIQRKVGDEPFRRLHITLRGIPGPGPERWFAAALALFVIAAGVRNALRPKSARLEPESASDFEARKHDLLERARELRALHAAGEIGPEYHMQQMTELESELAELLFEQAAHKKPPRGAAVAA